ncbi:LppP/LprE family lipoprotein [Kocuria coralli]|uniref:LppP/LprE family lipoprotein n=2 Tax=Kocuria coralli TaxID=1461025 RepID=A0A5J5KXY0_9MICC|nr:LppP/LprE family lipoprotein [Kocuria coralli]
MNAVKLRTAALGSSAAVLLLLTACGQGDGDASPTSAPETSASTETTTPAADPSATPSATDEAPSDEPTVPETTNPVATPTATPSPTQTEAPPTEPADEGCADLTGEEAVQMWGPEVPPYDAGFDQWEWDLDYAVTDGYDPCADLSSIILPIQGSTASSPHAVMFFHHGDYVGTATAEALGFYPDVQRVDDATLTITYHYPLDGESNAGASGRAVSTFHWDDASQSVQHSGEFPPYVEQ